MITYTKEFIEKSKKLYPNQFDYSEVEYVASKKKVKLYCLNHNEPFPVIITPSHHLGRNHGCRKCKSEAQSLRNTLSQKEFIERARKLYPVGFDFSQAKYVSAKSSVEVKCTTHSNMFVTTPDLIQSKRMAGCEFCIKENRSKGAAQASRKRILSVEDFKNRVQKAHGDKFIVDYGTYCGVNSPISATCNVCGNKMSTRAGRFVDWKGCPKCEKPSPPINRLSDKKLISNVTKRQGECFDVRLIERNNSARDSLVELTCKKHKEFKKTIKYGNSYHKITCFTCHPEKYIARTKEEKLLDELSRNFKSKNYLYQKVNLISGVVVYECPSHNTMVQLIAEHRKFGCAQCKKVENKDYFFSSLSDKQRECNDYSNATFSEMPLGKQKISYKCKLHLEKCFQNAASHLEGRTSCKKCHIEARRQKAEERRVSIVSSKRANFLKDAKEMWGEGRYSYPNIEKELFVLNNEITIFCHIHNKLFLCPAGAHISARKDKGRNVGRGCPDCKTDALREMHRTDFEEVKNIFLERGLEILSDENEYVNGRSKLSVKCINNHITLATVSKVIHSRQGCSECSGSIGEEITRHWFEEYFGCNFRKVRFVPSNKEHQWLELDGYNKELMIAFEYQGIYHIDPDVHDSKEKWVAQKKRDENTRKMCQELGIQLIEVELFNRYSFKDSDIVASLIKAFQKVGRDIDSTAFSNVAKIVKKVAKGSNRLIEIERVCKEHNLTLIDELMWLGREHEYKFRCNKCDYVFPSSLARRDIAKHKCCPRCAREIGGNKRKLSESRKDKSAILSKFSNKVQELGVKLTTKQWLGSSYEKVYEGLCLYCGKPVPLFDYNKVLKKGKLCSCQYVKR